VAHTHRNILGETAGSEQHAIAGADVLHLAGIGAREAIAGTDLGAQHHALIVLDDVFEVGAELNRNVVFLALREHRVDEAGTHMGRNGVAALHGVAAMIRNGFKLNADLVTEPVEVLNGFISNVTGEFRMSETAASAQNVAVEQIRIIGNASLLLHIRAGSSHSTAVDDGVAARGRHLVDHEDVLDADLMRFKSGCKTSKTGTDDQEIDGFIPLSGDLRGLGRSLTGGGHKTSRGKSASGTKEMTTRKFHIFLLSL
jgi:hypothetical protein